MILVLMFILFGIFRINSLFSGFKFCINLDIVFVLGFVVIISEVFLSFFKFFLVLILDVLMYLCVFSLCVKFFLLVFLEMVIM